MWRNPFFRYAAAILVAALALYLREVLKLILGEQHLYHTAWLGVVISAWYLGLGPSIVTLAIETVGTWYFFIPPSHDWRFQDRADVGALVGFVALSGLIIVLGEANRRGSAKRRAAEKNAAEEAQARLAQQAEAAEALRRHQLELEQKVEARTSELKMTNEKLRNLTVKLLQAQDEERRRLGRELHDSAGQLVTALGMNCFQIERHILTAAPELATLAAETQILARELTDEIRTTSYLLHPPLLEEHGLADALELYVAGLARRGNLEVELSVSDDAGRLAAEAELAIFRVIQECLTNVHRHSETKTAAIRLWRDVNVIRAEVEDHGRGIPAEKLRDIQSGNSGVGLAGMKERVRNLGGEIKIESSERGTTISLAIPASMMAASNASTPAPKLAADVTSA